MFMCAPNMDNLSSWCFPAAQTSTSQWLYELPKGTAIIQAFPGVHSPGRAQFQRARPASTGHIESQAIKSSLSQFQWPEALWPIKPATDRILTIGVLVRLVWLKIDGFHWFRWGSCPIYRGNPSIFNQKATYDPNLSCSVTLEKKGTLFPFRGRPFLVGQPPKKRKKGATEQLNNCLLKNSGHPKKGGGEG